MGLEDWERTCFAHDGDERVVHRRGSGPGVVVLAEMPGITPKVVAFAERLVDAGHTVAMPSLFGTDGRPASPRAYLSALPRACVSRQFAAFALDRTAPVAVWLRALARDLHERAGGPGVGVVGMCFTGGFGLAMMVDSSVIAPVLSQPSLPLGKRGRRSTGLSPDDLAIVQERVASGCPVLALRFTSDPLVGDERFDTLEQALGDGFVRFDITSPDPDHGIDEKAHSVLTEALVDEPGHPTRLALDTVLDFLDVRLRPD